MSLSVLKMPDKKKLWICIIPFVSLCIKLKE